MFFHGKISTIAHYSNIKLIKISPICNREIQNNSYTVVVILYFVFYILLLLSIILGCNLSFAISMCVVVNVCVCIFYISAYTFNFENIYRCVDDDIYKEELNNNFEWNIMYEAAALEAVSVIITREEK